MADPIITTTESQLVEILENIVGKETAAKSWTSSKTIFMAGLTILLGVSTAFGWTPVPNQEVAGGIVTVIGAIFAVLRTVTRKSLT